MGGKISGREGGNKAPISINGKKHIINDFEDIGNRNEILRLEIQNDKSVQRGTGSKSRKQEIQDENDS